MESIEGKLFDKETEFARLQTQVKYLVMEGEQLENENTTLRRQVETQKDKMWQMDNDHEQYSHINNITISGNSDDYPK